MAQPIFRAIVVSVSLVSTAFAQDSDWAAVMQLKPGTTISIKLSPGKSGHRIKPQLCRVLQTGSDEVHCGVISHDREWLRDFARDQIDEIRLEYIEDASIWRGALIGGAIVGGLFMWAGENATEGGVYFLEGAAMGAVAGAQTADGGHKVRHGPVIYRSNHTP